MQPVFYFIFYTLHCQMSQKSLSETKLLPSLRKKMDMRGNCIYYTQRNMPCLKSLVYAISSRTLGLDPRVVRVKHVVNKEALKHHASYTFIHLTKTLYNISNRDRS